jgi:RNA-directed DNA polymerase
MVHGSRGHAEALRAEAVAALAPLGLRLAGEKTRVVHIDEGFDFLGFTIRRMRKPGTSKHYVYTVPSKKAIQAVKDKVAVKTYRATQNQDLAALLQNVNRTLAERANYFRHGVSKAVFSAVDSYTWSRLMRWLWRKHKGRTRLGMTELRRRFCVPGIWIFEASGVRFTGAASVPVTRCRYRGTRIPTPWAPQPERQLPPAAKPSGQGTRKARCVVTRTPGLAGGPGNPPGAIPAGRPGPTRPRFACSPTSTSPSPSPCSAGKRPPQTWPPG